MLLLISFWMYISTQFYHSFIILNWKVCFECVSMNFVSFQEVLITIPETFINSHKCPSQHTIEYSKHKHGFWKQSSRTVENIIQHFCVCICLYFRSELNLSLYWISDAYPTVMFTIETEPLHKNLVSFYSNNFFNKVRELWVNRDTFFPS